MFLWPIILAPVLEELVSLGGDVIRAALEAFAWHNRIEGAAVASVFWILVILLGWLFWGKSRPSAKIAVMAAALLSVVLGYLGFVHATSFFPKPSRPLLPIIRPHDPKPKPDPQPWRPFRRGDEPPLAVPDEKIG